mmetsp:Transcript_120131/g.299688  ORF Transcript_120131/g.299688 Transcript_120131/m.299688 type:complete len:251 (-) Transcript_120131:279-1031(-)
MLDAVLIELSIQTDSLGLEIDVHVLLPLESLPHVIQRLISHLGTVGHQLQPHVLLRLLGLRLLSTGDEVLHPLVSVLDLSGLLLLRLHQRLHRAVELLRLLADPLRISLDLVVLDLVALVHGLVGGRLGIQVLYPLVVLLQLRLVAFLLLPHHLDFFLQHVALVPGPLELRLGLCLPLDLSLLQGSLLLALLVLELGQLYLQHHVAVLYDLVLALNLQDLVTELLDAGLILLRLQRRLLQADLLCHEPVV